MYRIKKMKYVKAVKAIQKETCSHRTTFTYTTYLCFCAQSETLNFVYNNIVSSFHIQIYFDNGFTYLTGQQGTYLSTAQVNKEPIYGTLLVNKVPNYGILLKYLSYTHFP